MNAFARATALAAVLLASTPVAALAQTAPPLAAASIDLPELNLAAYGEVKVVPDMAAITLGVQTTAAAASDAMRQNAAQMTQVIAALRRAGIAEKDIRTSSIGLSAQYAYAQNEPPKLTGYQASNAVTVTVEDLSRLGPALDAVTAAGANQVSGVNLGLKDPGAAQDQARLAAVRALRAKADLYAGATGYRVARLVNLGEQGGYQPGPIQPMAVSAMRAGAESVPVSAGELTVRIDITGTYQLSR